MKVSYTNPEIAKVLGDVSRAYVNQTLKSSLRKLFFGIIYYDIADTAIDSFKTMINFLDLENEDDINELFKKLDGDIKVLIRSDIYGKVIDDPNEEITYNL